MFETILFPVDQSRESREAADVVVHMAQAHHSKVLVLAVLNEAATAPVDSAKIEQLLDGVKEFLSQRGVTQVETLERTGNPPFMICDVADELEAGLIIMGSKGTGMLEDDHPESVSHRVIDLSPCPVLVVP